MKDKTHTRFLAEEDENGRCVFAGFSSVTTKTLYFMFCSQSSNASSTVDLTFLDCSFPCVFSC